VVIDAELAVEAIGRGDADSVLSVAHELTN
jgi:hypothetical protein